MRLAGLHPAEHVATFGHCQKRLSELAVNIGRAPPLIIQSSGPTVFDDALERVCGDNEYGLLASHLHVHTAQDLLEMGGSLGASLATIRDDEGGLSGPLMVEKVEGVLEACWNAPVVLRRDKDEAVMLANPGGPAPCVVVCVVWAGVVLWQQGWDSGLIVEWKALCFEIDDGEVDLGVLGGQDPKDVVGDVWVKPGRPGATGDDGDVCWC